MEKKQITNSNTVSRAVKDPHRDQGWEPPLRLGACHAQPFSPLLPRSYFPRKERSLQSFHGPVTTFQQDHFLGPKEGSRAPLESRASPG